MPEGVRVSVVMPVHNAAPYVEMAVQSALASDLRQLEVIVVDDGSEDQSAAIVEAISDPRVVLVRTPPSGGPSRPRNIGIARAKAPYVAFLDADDLIKPDKLSTAVAALEQHPHAAFAFADFESVDENDALLKASFLSGYEALTTLTAAPTSGGWHLIRQQQLARALVRENFIGTSGVVARTAIVAKIGAFDEQLKYSEDRDLWFRLAHSYDALYRDRVGHSYRIRTGSLT